MIRMISVKCPDCGAALEFEEGRTTAFCSYCGAKILLHNENEYVFRTIDEAGMKQADNDRLFMMKELEMQDKEDRHHRALKVVLLICTILLFTVGIIMVCTGPKDPDDPGYMLMLIGMLVGLCSMVNSDSGEKKQPRHRPGTIKVPGELSAYQNMHYSAVESALRAAGYTNIKLINLGDLRLGLLRKNGSVSSVTIDGEYLRTDKWYLKDAPVIISYHGFAD